MSNEKRLERVMRLVKIGRQIKDPATGYFIPGAYALEVEGRDTYGSSTYFSKGGGHKTLVLSANQHTERPPPAIDMFMVGKPYGNWRRVHPRLEAMILLALMGQY